MKENLIGSAVIEILGTDRETHIHPVTSFRDLKRIRKLTTLLYYLLLNSDPLASLPFLELSNNSVQYLILYQHEMKALLSCYKGTVHCYLLFLWLLLFMFYLFQKLAIPFDLLKVFNP